jgi:hypothetical protein
MSLSGKAELKVNRIKAQNAGALGLLGAAVAPESLGRVIGGKLRTTRTNVVELRAMKQTLSTMGLYCRADGFDPTRSFQHVANIDNEIWQVILGMFAKYNEETGEFEDDGLLYKYDTHSGCVKLHKDFFFALIDFLEASGYPCDMRGKIKLT